VTRSYPGLLVFLGAVWGASYLFIKVAVDDFAPATMMALRLLIASAVLVPFLLLRLGPREGLGELRGAWRPGLMLGILNGAIPFTLIAWGEQHIDSGIAAVANAAVPLFVVLLALRFKPSERVTGLRLAGVLLGLVGVGVLAGAEPGGGVAYVAGTLAVVLAALAYAAGGLLGQSKVATTSGPVLATASMLGGGLVLLPFALLQLPDRMPSWEAIAAVVALAVLGTTLAQLVYFRMLRLHGSSRTSLVTYLIPPVALVYGTLLLDEALTAAAIAGLALILIGVALGSGAVRSLRRAAFAGRA